MGSSVIIDGFTFFNEHELLRLRLKTLAPVVDHFIISESAYTFTGLPKGRKFDWKVVEGYEDKISYLFDERPPEQNPWSNEHRQRTIINRELGQFKDDDWFISGDLDEIPEPSMLQDACDPSKFYVFSSKTCYYRLNWFALDHDSSKMVQMGRLRRQFKNDPGEFRDHWDGPDRVTLLGGWHFSYMADGTDSADAIRTKMLSFSHTEFATPQHINKTIEDSRSMIDCRGRQLYMLDRKYWPKEVTDNEEHYRSIGWLA